MTTSAPENLSDRGHTLSAIQADLYGNQLLLEELVQRYRIFRFTGGTVPAQSWRLAELAAYRQQPFLVDRLRADLIERYQELAAALMTQGVTVADGGPRTIRARRAIADTFTGMAAEIRAAGALLQSALALLVQEQAGAVPVPVRVSP